MQTRIEDIVLSDSRARRVAPFARDRRISRRSGWLKPLALGVAFSVLCSPAAAVLEMAGPVDPAHGFPDWYLDRNGVALELCINTDAAVLAAGGCAILLAAAPLGVTTVPEVFPSNWAVEHFYTLAAVALNTAGLDKKTGTPISGAGHLVINMGLEGSFTSGVPTPGQQIAFNRWRVRQDNLACSGSYTYYTPNNSPQTISGQAGGRIVQTADIGIGTFDGPLAGSTGPFLQWSDLPGGALKPPYIGADGKKYISDYNLVGTPVTGSDLPNPLRASAKAWIPAEIKAMPFANYVLIEGPGVATGNCALTESVSTTTGFQLFGRFFEGPIPTPANIDRATYRAVDTNADGLPDSFQIGVWATAAQKSVNLLPALGMSVFSGDPAAPTVVSPELAMNRSTFSLGGAGRTKYEFFQGATAPKQSGVPLNALTKPAATQARVRVVTDSPATILIAPLVDELRISQALWDSAQKTLTVTAESGAMLAAATPLTQTALNADCSAPCLRLDTLGLPAADINNAPIDYKLRVNSGSRFAVATAVIPNVKLPPARVTVFSSGGGSDSQPVMYAGSAAGIAMVRNDLASTNTNTPVSIDVLANDVGVATTPSLLVCTAATGGTCGFPSATAVCTAGVASPSCTASGARLAISVDNRIVYSPKLNLAGTSENFWYQVNTANGAARAQVTVNVGTLNGLPVARDDAGLGAVVNRTETINVLTNDFAPAGVNAATLRITQGPCIAATAGCSAGSARFNALGQLLFTPPAPGVWNMTYTFDDKNGATATPGVVTVNAVAAETLLFQRARWTAPKKAGQLGTLDAAGTSSILLTHTLELRSPNATTGAQGCSNPAAGTRIATTTVAANGTWTVAATPLSAKPATVYIYSPANGACTQTTVQ